MLKGNNETAMKRAVNAVLWSIAPFGTVCSRVHILVKTPVALCYAQLFTNSVEQFLPIGKCSFIENEKFHLDTLIDTFSLIVPQQCCCISK